MLRALGRNQEAIGHYGDAKALFERTPGANGKGDIGNCLYGIALARDAEGNPAQAAAAWNDYLRFAGNNQQEQAAVAIARTRMSTNLARAQRPAG